MIQEKREKMDSKVFTRQLRSVSLSTSGRKGAMGRHGHQLYQKVTGGQEEAHGWVAILCVFNDHSTTCYRF